VTFRRPTKDGGPDAVSPDLTYVGPPDYTLGRVDPGGTGSWKEVALDRRPATGERMIFCNAVGDTNSGVRRGYTAFSSVCVLTSRAARVVTAWTCHSARSSLPHRPTPHPRSRTEMRSSADSEGSNPSSVH
jgi:hypothetical protein